MMIILIYEFCYVAISKASIQYLGEEGQVIEEAVHAQIRRRINTEF